MSFSCGAYYFLTIVDDVSRGILVYLMKDKSEIGHFLRGFIVVARNQFGKVVKLLRSDNGSGFKLDLC